MSWRRLRGRAMVAGVGILVAACSAESSEVSKSQEMVSAKLKDPGSAQFRNVKRLRDGVVCGEVNSKNSFGGYAGFSPFVVELDEKEFPVTMVDGPLPRFMSEGYPAEELAQCFPQLLPELKGILGEDFGSKKG